MHNHPHEIGRWGHWPDTLSDKKRLQRARSGTVFRVKGGAGGVVYALKEEVIQTEEEAREAVAETKVMVKLRQVNLAKCIGYLVGQRSGGGYLFSLLMPLYDYDLMGRRASNGPLQPSEAHSLVLHISNALMYLHGRRYIHRDVKPQNVFFCRAAQRWILGDFGHPRSLERSSVSHSKRRGTHLYLPPEVHGRDAYTENMDLWGFGVSVVVSIMKDCEEFEKKLFLNHTEALRGVEKELIKVLGEVLGREVGVALTIDPRCRSTSKKIFEIAKGVAVGSDATTLDVAGRTSVAMHEVGLKGAAQLIDTSLSSFGHIKNVENNFLKGNPNLCGITLNPLHGVRRVGDNFLSGAGVTSIDLSPLSNVSSIGSGFLANCVKLTFIDWSPLSELAVISKGFLTGCAELCHLDLTYLESVIKVDPDDFLSGCMKLQRVKVLGGSELSSACQSILEENNNNIGNFILEELWVDAVTESRERRGSFKRRKELRSQ